MKKKIIIATIKSWNIANALKFKKTYSGKYNILLITKKENLNYSCVKKFNPRCIFFPHWSWIIPEKIYRNYKCIVFHMTDLPLGRGGSPLQNLIIRGFTKTKISAIKVIQELDAGPIYLKRNLSLYGSAKGIYRKASNIVFKDMIPHIIKNEPKPIPQKGKVVLFKRRKLENSQIPEDIDLNGIYNYIRMLDAEGYPHAFIETKNFRFEFIKAVKKTNSVEAYVYIRKREK